MWDIIPSIMTTMASMTLVCTSIHLSYLRSKIGAGHLPFLSLSLLPNEELHDLEEENNGLENK